MTDSFELLYALKKIGYLKTERDPYWWPSSGTFEVIVGAILTQNTRWQKVEKALENLKVLNALTLNGFLKLDRNTIAQAVKPAGFYNTKAKRLKDLSQKIKEEFGSFKTFKEQVTRDWLLRKKGVGPESVDSILCYACYRDEMVVDSYTARLLGAFGYTMEEYDMIKDWLMGGLLANMDKIYALYDHKIPLNKLYARFHGKIVEYCKEHMGGKKVDVSYLKSIEFM